MRRFFRHLYFATGNPFVRPIPIIVPGQTFVLSEFTSSGTNVGVLLATESPTSWTIVSGNTGNAFTLSNAGLLTTAATLNAGTTPSYTLNVTATNAIGVSAQVAITVQVIVPSYGFNFKLNSMYLPAVV